MNAGQKRPTKAAPPARKRPAAKKSTMAPRPTKKAPVAPKSDVVAGKKQNRTRADGSIEFKVTGRYAELMDGRLRVEDLDPEELARCQLKDKNGRFTGKPPKYLPAELVKRMRREFFDRGDKEFENSYLKAVQTLVKIMDGPMYDEAVRLKAAIFMIERLRGKTPDVIVHGTPEELAPWQRALTRVIITDARSGDTEEDVVEAEIVA